jgi:hypothetical protein
MKHKLYLGALNKLTGEYVYPKIANKKDNYICPECNKDLILVQGKIRNYHFRHKADNINPCHHYSNPCESQIHKNAKMLMKTLLERKIPISFIRNCCCCKKNEEFEIPEISETSNIYLEYRFEYNGIKIADVAYMDDDEILCIFEICNTHKTCSENRPEPWFEINAETFIKLANDNTLTSLEIPCVRCDKCEECLTKERELILNIRKEVQNKSNFNESDSYCCNSKVIMEILINIICGDDTYEKWSNTYRVLFELFDEENNLLGLQYENHDMMEKNINLGYDSWCNCCDTYYNDDLIKDIQNMRLYKYLKSMYVWHGQARFKFGGYGCQIDTDNIENKLKQLCKELFGEKNYDCVVVWDTNISVRCIETGDKTTDLQKIKHINKAIEKCKKSFVEIDIGWLYEDNKSQKNRLRALYTCKNFIENNIEYTVCGNNTYQIKHPISKQIVKFTSKNKLFVNGKWINVDFSDVIKWYNNDTNNIINKLNKKQEIINNGDTLKYALTAKNKTERKKILSKYLKSNNIGEINELDKYYFTQLYHKFYSYPDNRCKFNIEEIQNVIIERGDYNSKCFNLLVNNNKYIISIKKFN